MNMTFAPVWCFFGHISFPLFDISSLEPEVIAVHHLAGRPKGEISEVFYQPPHLRIQF